jgi:biopolymer transport protein ExbD
MKKLIWVIPVIIGFLSCKGQSDNHAADQNKLSVLIFHDSVIVYNGVFDKTTAYKKYLLTEPEKLKEVIEQNRRKYGSQSEILLKIANKGGADLADLIQYMGDISTQNSGPDLKIADITETEEQFFSVFPFKKSFLDSLSKPSALELNMPGEGPEEKKLPPASLTLILFEDSIIYYHKSLKDARKASYTGARSIRKVIQQEKKDVPEKDLIIIIKPTGNATYTNTVDVLDEMTINNIKHFAMVKVTKEEEEALGVKPFSLEHSSPVAVEIPSSISTRIEDKGFLIELKKDRSVWYSITTDNLEQRPQKVNEPIRKNIGNLIAKYKDQSIKQGLRYRFLVKGHPDTKFPLFEEVLGALKDNDEFKYNLITTDN